MLCAQPDWQGMLRHAAILAGQLRFREAIQLVRRTELLPCEPSDSEFIAQLKSDLVETGMANTNAVARLLRTILVTLRELLDMERNRVCHQSTLYAFIIAGFDFLCAVIQLIERTRRLTRTATANQLTRATPWVNQRARGRQRKRSRRLGMGVEV